MKKIAACFVLSAVFGIANVQADLVLVPNGDFESQAGEPGTTWQFAGVGAAPTFSATGGNTDGHATIDQTAGGWGGVLVSEDSATAGRSLVSLGLTAGTTYDFFVDMISLGAGTPTAGMKIESWNAGALLNNSGDVVFPTTASWATYTVPFTVDAAATSVKFVPLLVGQAAGSSVGFDNVGVENLIPEPSSLALIGLGAVALGLYRRRR